MQRAIHVSNNINRDRDSVCLTGSDVEYKWRGDSCQVTFDSGTDHSNLGEDDVYKNRFVITAPERRVNLFQYWNSSQHNQMENRFPPGSTIHHRRGIPVYRTPTVHQDLFDLLPAAVALGNPLFIRSTVKKFLISNMYRRKPSFDRRRGKTAHTVNSTTQQARGTYDAECKEFWLHIKSSGVCCANE